jgi:membrane protein YdbS with pleckstrin-like domain
MELLISALGSIAISTPIIIVLLIGIALALLRWRRHPRVSLLTLIASAVMIVGMIGAIFLYA